MPWSKSIKSSPNCLLTFDVRLCTTLALSFFADLGWVTSPMVLPDTWLICRGGNAGAIAAAIIESFWFVTIVPNDAVNCVWGIDTFNGEYSTFASENGDGVDGGANMVVDCGK